MSATDIEHERNGNDGEPVWSYNHDGGLEFRWWGGGDISVYREGEVVPFSSIGISMEEAARLRDDYDAFENECDECMDRLEEEAAQAPYYG